MHVSTVWENQEVLDQQLTQCVYVSGTVATLYYYNESAIGLDLGVFCQTINELDSVKV